MILLAVMRFLPVFFAAAAITAGCARTKPDRTANSTPSISGRPTNLVTTAASSPSGKIVRVNATARFVVINYPLTTVPPSGQTLNVYRNGLKVGEVKVSGPQQDYNTVADLIAGEAQMNDEVRSD